MIPAPIAYIHAMGMGPLSKIDVTDPSILVYAFQPPRGKSMVTKCCYKITTAVIEFTFYSRQ